MYSRIQSLSKWALVEPWIASPRVVPQVCIAMLDAIETAALGIAWVLLIANAVVPAIAFASESIFGGCLPPLYNGLTKYLRRHLLLRVYL